MSIHRTQTGQTGLSAYAYELAAIGNSLRELQQRYADLIETIASEMPDSTTGSEVINEKLTLNYPASGLRQKLRQSATLTQQNIYYVSTVLNSIDQSSDEYKPVDPKLTTESAAADFMKAAEILSDVESTPNHVIEDLTNEAGYLNNRADGQGWTQEVSQRYVASSRATQRSNVMRWLQDGQPNSHMVRQALRIIEGR